jgi:hypothetical protein
MKGLLGLLSSKKGVALGLVGGALLLAGAQLGVDPDLILALLAALGVSHQVGQSWVDVAREKYNARNAPATTVTGSGDELP